MKSILLLLALILVVCTCVRAQRPIKDDGFPVRTEVKQGTLEGLYSVKTGIRHYLGVPFAAPPIGDLRWKAPQSPANYEGVRMAKEFGPRAIQKFVFDDMRFRSDGLSEDCLYLNVWTPGVKGDDPLPVLLYFHGGGNVTGSGDELRYDGEMLAQKGVIVVTANYRLGVFGFFSHPDLSAEPGNPGGNYGLLDQVAAINWVSANIEAFGGNPDKITIGGESAGSIDCSMLMASPLSRDKLAGVLGQSGAAILGGMTPVSPEIANAKGVQFLKTVGVESLAELRKAPASVIYEGEWNGVSPRFGPVVDGHFLPKTPLEIYEAGEQPAIPLMVGWTSTEVAWASPPESEASFRKQIEAQYGSNAKEMLEAYSPADYKASATALASDNWIVLGTWKWADLHAKKANQSVYRYQFDRIRPPLVGEERAAEPPGAGHATDIEYFFNSMGISDAYEWEDADRKTAATMSDYLVNFIKTGDPNGGTLPVWKPMEGTANPTVLHLDSESTSMKAQHDDRYQLLERLARKQ